MAFAPGTPGKAYAISRAGKTFRKDDVSAAGAWATPGTWTTTDVRQLAIHPDRDDRLYAITGGQVARSTDGGASWNPVGATLPTSELNSIIAHPTLANILYLGAGIGVFISYDEGEIWGAYDDGLPNAEVLQIFWEGEYLYAVTHGRGLWRLRECG